MGGPDTLGQKIWVGCWGLIEVLNVVVWLTHGDFALQSCVDFSAVVEHRLIPARVRSEWKRLKKGGVETVWNLPSQKSAHVRHAGVGVISLRGVPLSLPTFATEGFRRFVNVARVVRCLLPLGGRFMHLVVVYGFQGATKRAEQLQLTEQLFDTVLQGVGCFG